MQKKSTKPEDNLLAALGVTSTVQFDFRRTGYADVTLSPNATPVTKGFRGVNDMDVFGVGITQADQASDWLFLSSAMFERARVGEVSLRNFLPAMSDQDLPVDLLPGLAPLRRAPVIDSEFPEDWIGKCLAFSVRKRKPDLEEPHHK